MPNNLKIYSDSSYNNIFSSISSTHLESDSITTRSYSLYWKWEYLDDENSNTNDSLYINKELVLPITISFVQRLGNL